MTSPSSTPPIPAFRRRRRAFAWLAVAVVLLVAVAKCAHSMLDWVVGDDYLTQVAQGDGWVAFVRRVDYRLIADSDSSVWLARSTEDRSTWHRLADAADSVELTWTGPRHLRIWMSHRWPGADLVTQVEDVTIEWAF